MGALHAACLKSAADGPRAGRYTDFSGPRGRLQKWVNNGRKWPKMAKNGRKWPTIAKTGRKMGENGQQWPKMAIYLFFGYFGPFLTIFGLFLTYFSPFWLFLTLFWLFSGRKAVWVAHQEHMGRVWDHSSDDIVKSSYLAHYGRWRRPFAPF